DGLVDRLGEAEIVAGDDQGGHSAQDACRGTMRPSRVSLNSSPRHTKCRLARAKSQEASPTKSRSGNQPRPRTPSRSPIKYSIGPTVAMRTATAAAKVMRPNASKPRSAAKARPNGTARSTTVARKPIGRAAQVF